MGLVASQDSRDEGYSWVHEGKEGEGEKRLRRGFRSLNFYAKRIEIQG